MATMLSARSKKKFFSEAVIPPDSNLIGRDVNGVQLFKRDGVRLIDVVRGDTSLRRNLAGVALQVGDRVVRRRYAVYPLAVQRRDANISQQIDDVIVRVGDTLLLEGAPEDIQRLAEDMNLGDVSKPSQRAYRRGHAPVAIAVLLGVVTLAALGVAPILMLAMVGVTIVLMTGCIDADEAFSYVDGRLLALIFAMLGVGSALQSSGAVALIADTLSPVMLVLPGFFVVLAVYLLSSILTELVSNNAVAVVMTPIAIGLASALGVDPRPLVVAVMIAASASFATPIGYQTNTLVYGPGGYRFSDFLKFGIPLNLSLAPIVSFVIPFIWPL